MAGLRRPEVPLFVMALASYAFFYQAGGWNQNTRLDMTRAIVERGTVRIDAYADNTGDRACRGPEGRCITARPGVDHYYGDKAPGVSWLAIPVWSAVWSLRGDADESEIVERGSYLATLFAVALPASVGVAALSALLGALGVAPPVRGGVCLAYALGSLAFPYATLFYGHAPAAALGLLGFTLLVRFRGEGEGPGFGTSLASGFSLGAAVAVEYPALLVAAASFAYAATRPWRGRRRALLGLLVGGALPATALAAYHALAFGGVLSTGYAFSTMPHRGAGWFMGMGWPKPGALFGLTFSSYRGLFVTSPWLLLALPGWLFWWRRARAEAAVCLAVAGGFAAMQLSLLDWAGGWTLGPRHLIPSLPYWAVGAAGVLAAWPERWPRGRSMAMGLFAVMALVSAASMLVATAVGPEVDERVASPFAQRLLPRFAAGELALSTQSYEMALPAHGGPPRAWNLGQRMGLPGLWSLAPLVALWWVCGAWLWCSLRGSARTLKMSPWRPRSIPSPPR